MTIPAATGPRQARRILRQPDFMRPAFEICYITDRHALEPQPLLPFIVEAVRAGVDLLQIREKDLATRELLELVKGAVSAAEGTTTRVVVNDRLDVALAAGAAGVHLGTRSLPAAVVRRQVSRGFLVGVSCHALEEVAEAEQAGADYVVIGRPITKPPSAIGSPAKAAELIAADIEEGLRQRAA